MKTVGEIEQEEINSITYTILLLLSSNANRHVTDKLNRTALSILFQYSQNNKLERVINILKYDPLRVTYLNLIGDDDIFGIMSLMDQSVDVNMM